MFEAKFSNLMNDMTDIVSYASTVDTYELLYMNEYTLKIFGETKESIVGKKCYKIIQKRDEPCPFCTNSILKLNEIYKWKFYNEALDRHFSISDTLVMHEDKLVRLETAFDIDIEVATINNLGDFLKINNLVLDCASSFFDGSTYSISINKLLKTICEYYTADKVYIYELDSKKKYLVNTSNFYSNNVEQEILKEIPYKYVSKWFKRNDDGEPTFHYIDASNETSFTYEYDSMKYVKSIIVSPLRRNNKIIGFIGVSNPKTGIDNSYLLKTLTAFAVNELDKRRLSKRLEKKVLQLEETLNLDTAILACATNLLNNDDIDTSITELLKNISIYYGSAVAHIFEFDYESKKTTITFKYINPDYVEDVYYEVPYDTLKNIMKMCNEDGYIHFPNPECVKELHPEIYVEFINKNIFSLIVKPLKDNNELVGFLSVINYEKNGDNLRFLDTVCAFTTSDLKKRNLIRELETLSFVDALTSLPNRNEYLHKINVLTKNPPKKLGIIFADVNGLKKVNDKLGHKYGDYLIRWAGDFLHKYVGRNVYRTGGDEFVAIIDYMEDHEFGKCFVAMLDELETIKDIGMSLGGAWSFEATDINSQIIEADKNMYIEKQKFYKKMKLETKPNIPEIEQLKNLQNKLEGLFPS